MTSKTIYKLIRTITITLILFYCTMGRSQEVQDTQYVYALVRDTQSSDITWSDLEKSDGGIYNIKEESYKRLSTIERDLVFTYISYDIKRLKNIKRSSPTKHRLIRIDTIRVNVYISEGKRQDTFDMKMNYYNGMIKYYRRRS